jgi:hypothetical protein
VPVFNVELDPWDRALSVVAAHGGEVLERGKISLPPDADPAALVAALVASGIAVRALTPVRKSLEDFYLELRRNGTPDPHALDR